VCKSGYCVDGVCCNAPCDGVCEACNVVSDLGVCIGHPVGTDPEGECPDAQLCAGPGMCVPEDRPNGTECDRDAVCGSGHCADGVCCDTACDGECEACNTEDGEGQCVPFAPGTDPADECAGDQVCSGERSCISYETRGNGLCTLRADRRPLPAWLLAGLLSVAVVLVARRRPGGRSR
jgi:hypothetical protein